MAARQTNEPRDGNFREPIAIIGMGCRFPGADSPGEFWQLLKNDRNPITEIPSDRFDVDAYYDSKPSTPGKVITRLGGFLKNIDQFDASFFGISPREAVRLDPQQRLLLEVALEAFEDAGLTAESLAASRAGVFVGLWANDYERSMFNAFSDIDLYATTGGGRYAASGRISYAFDLRGPSMTVDTACSSSLVTVHLACNSLRNGESSVALAGGANLILQPQVTIGYSQGRMLSPDASCKFGDASANGYVRSEGVGLVVLKTLSRALADGDSIHALIRGSAVNNDGRSSTLLVAPSPKGQQEMLFQAYEDANVSPAQIHYVEAHGTGTPVGDVVELEALGAVLSQGRPKDRPCQLGSVKTKIGHAEAASGIAGLLKAIFVLKNRVVPGNSYFRVPNPKIPWSTLPVVMQRELGPLNVQSGPAFAAVNSFGITGTNAHVILEEAPRQVTGMTDPIDASGQDTPGAPKKYDAISPNLASRCFLLPLSAHSARALKDRARDFKEMLHDETNPVNLADICYTASRRITQREHRLTAAGNNRQEIAEQLDAFLRKEVRLGLSSGRVNDDAQRKVAFVFCGQGPQWWAMGRELLEQPGVFRETIVQCDALLRNHADWSLMAELQATENASRLDQTEICQPVLFALQVALAAQWRSWGVRPDAVVGHSFGEVAAAHVAGVLSLPEAIRVVFNRGRFMQKITATGKMAEVELPVEEARALLIPYGDRLCIAAVNSPKATVISGEIESLDGVLSQLAQRGIVCRTLPLKFAFHSPQMAPFESMLASHLKDLSPEKNSVAMVSTVTGGLLNGEDLTGAYWGNNIRRTVLFNSAIECLDRAGCNIFVEIGPHPVLARHISLTLAGKDAPVVVVPSLRSQRPEALTLLGSLGALHANGVPVDWNAICPSGGRYVSLPTYPWQRERFWFESSEAVAAGKNAIEKLSKEPSLKELKADVKQAVVVADEDLRDLLYRVTWRRENLSESVASAVPTARKHSGTWIVFADATGVAKSLTSRLSASGDKCILVFPGETSKDAGDGSYVLSPNRVEDFHDLFTNKLSKELSSSKGIIFLWSLDSSPSETLTCDNLDKATVIGSGAVLHLIQSLARAERKNAIRLWLVTRQARRVIDTDTLRGLSQSPLWGIGRVVANERPELRSVRVDLGAETSEMEINSLGNEIRLDSTEEEIAFRGGVRYVGRLQHWKPSVTGSGSATTAAEKQIRPRDWSEGTYLITGGFGGIGLEIARWLVGQNAKHLVLAGRRGASVASQSSIAEFRNAGVQVLETKIDVSQPEEVARLFAEIEHSMPSLRGVFHAAGVLDDGVLTQLDQKRLALVMAPKVRGGWNLHASSLGKSVDLFVLFSSAVALLGPPGQGNYASANSFLDALASYRQSLGLHALSINWGPWSDVGLAAAQTNRGDRLANRGLGSLSPNVGISILSFLLSQKEPQVSAMRFRLDQWQEFHPRASASPFFDDLRTKAVGAPPESVADEVVADNFRELLLATESGSRRSSLLRDHVQEHVAKVLGMSVARVDSNKPLRSLGIDSLMALELTNGLQASLGLTLSATTVWNYPTVVLLSEHVNEKLEEQLEKSGASTSVKSVISLSSEAGANGQIDQILAEIERLSDEEAHRKMSEKIG